MSARTRVVVIVAVAAALAAGATVLLARDGKGGTHGQALPKGPPRLYLDLGIRDDAEARALRRAGNLYVAGHLAQARAIFERYGSIEAQVGDAFASWPSGTLARLEGLAAQTPGNSFVLLHLALARVWSGDDAGGIDAFRQAERAQPDTVSALRAEDLLHPRSAPGLPIFEATYPPLRLTGSATARLAALRRAAGGPSVRARVLYGVALAQLGRRVSAEREFRAAAQLAPDDPQPATAAAVTLFDKENPARAFARLGPLARRFPHAATVRFHLGLLLLWLDPPQLKQAKVELRKAIQAEPRSPLAKQARELLDRLAGRRTKRPGS